MNQYDEAVKAFHMMWDSYSGIARLIDRSHHIIAANPAAREKGFSEDTVCARVGVPQIHRECKMKRMFDTGETQIDHVLPDRLRLWMPVAGYPDLMVHYAVMIPEEE